MKLAAVCVFVLVLAIVETSFAQSHNFEWGRREAGDRQLYREIVTKKYSILQIVTKDVSYRGAARITYIKCTDQYTNGNGGYVSLLEGGPGYTDVKFHFKSQRGHGFNFIAEIYGQ